VIEVVVVKYLSLSGLGRHGLVFLLDLIIEDLLDIYSVMGNENMFQPISLQLLGETVNRYYRIIL
jgi:hypothetical protein